MVNIKNRARVVEEVSLGKDVAEKLQTITETLRWRHFVHRSR
jgi:hypothetical protein